MTKLGRFLFEGEMLPLYVIARRVGMVHGTLYHRVIRIGMTVEEAVSISVLPRARKAPWGRTTKLYDFRGERLSAKQIAALLNVTSSTVYARVRGNHVLEAEEANKGRRDIYRITYDGRTLTLSEWARETGIRAETIRERIRQHGWSAERALTEPVAPPLAVRRRMAAAKGTRIRIVKAAARASFPTGGQAPISQSSPGTGGGSNAHDLPEAGLSGSGSEACN